MLSSLSKDILEQIDAGKKDAAEGLIAKEAAGKNLTLES